ncbi:MAG: AI-2E family transporter, partial [bacterium]
MDRLRKDVQFYFFLILTLYFGWQLLIAASGVVQFFQEILIILFLGWFLYFIINPVVKLVTHKKIPRIASVMLVFFVLVALITLGLALLIPRLINQLNLLNDNLPTLMQNAGQYIQDRLLEYKWLDRARLESTITSSASQILSFSSSLISNWLSILSGTLSTVISVFMVILVAAFFLIDAEKISHYIRKMVPREFHDEFSLLEQKINTSFGGFIRGQFIMGIINGILTWIVLAALGVNLSLLAGILAAVVMFIPFFNMLFGFLPGFIITLIVRPELWLVVLIVLFVVHQIELNII